MESKSGTQSSLCSPARELTKYSGAVRGRAKQLFSAASSGSEMHDDSPLHANGPSSQAALI